jgi:Domain of unknown function (DUF4386)
MSGTGNISDRDQRAARIAGFLFLNAILFLFVGEAQYRPWISPLDLEGVTAHRHAFLLGVLVEWAASVPLILMIPVLLFPIFARHSMRAAMAYLALRLLEVSLLSVADVKKLLVLDLAAWSDRAVAETTAQAHLAEAAWIDSAGLVYNLVFGASALVLFGTLLSARLVPRLISLWGLFAAMVLMGGAILFSLDLVPATLAPVIWAPIALAEVGLALWLIVKGVSSDR